MEFKRISIFLLNFIEVRVARYPKKLLVIGHRGSKDPDEFVLFLSAFIHKIWYTITKTPQNTPAEISFRKWPHQTGTSGTKPRSIGETWDSHSPSFICKEGRQQTIYIAGWFAGLTFHIPRMVWGGAAMASWRRCEKHTRDWKSDQSLYTPPKKTGFFFCSGFHFKSRKRLSDL